MLFPTSVFSSNYCAVVLDGNKRGAVIVRVIDTVAGLIEAIEPCMVKG